jgi:hypothetical protein
MCGRERLDGALIALREVALEQLARLPLGQARAVRPDAFGVAVADRPHAAELVEVRPPAEREALELLDQRDPTGAGVHRVSLPT